MKFQLLAVSAALVLSQSVWAKPVSLQPDKCPSVMSFIQTGVNDAGPTDEDLLKWWGIEERNQFDTNNTWSFFVGSVHAEYKSEALAKANAAIPTLKYVRGPESVEFNQEGIWICLYRGDTGINGVAINGLDDNKLSLLKQLEYRK